MSDLLRSHVLGPGDLGNLPSPDRVTMHYDGMDVSYNPGLPAAALAFSFKTPEAEARWKAILDPDGGCAWVTPEPPSGA